MLSVLSLFRAAYKLMRVNAYNHLEDEESIIALYSYLLVVKGQLR
jgi:hypothetical protein